MTLPWSPFPLPDNFASAGVDIRNYWFCRSKISVLQPENPALLAIFGIPSFIIILGVMCRTSAPPLCLYRSLRFLKRCWISEDIEFTLPCSPVNRHKGCVLCEEDPCSEFVFRVCIPFGLLLIVLPFFGSGLGERLVGKFSSSCVSFIFT